MIDRTVAIKIKGVALLDLVSINLRYNALNYKCIVIDFDKITITITFIYIIILRIENTKDTLNALYLCLKFG